MRFYVFRKPKPSNYDPHDTEFEKWNDNFDNAPTCPECGAYVALMPWRGPFDVTLQLFGSDYGDIAYCSGDGWLVSGRFKDLYSTHALCGISEFHPVNVHRVEGQGITSPHPAYYYINARPTTVDVDDAASGIERDEATSCSVCRGASVKRIDRIVVRENTWSGEDWFRMCALPGIVIVSDRMHELLVARQISNVDLIPAEEFSLEW